MTRILPLLLLCACASTPTLPVPSWQHNSAPIMWEDRELQGLCGSQIRGGLGVIYWDAGEWKEATPWRQAFCAGHEHAHIDAQDASELATDCAAVLWMRAAGYLDSSATEAALFLGISLWPPSGEHPSGTLRALAIGACLWSL